jgi:TctA family transporter
MKVPLLGIRDWWANKWLSARCSIIGVVVGVIPGLGGSVVDWIAYGHAVQTSQDKSKFGSGDIRGVIGPESSNNAKEGGGLVPTLLTLPVHVDADVDALWCCSRLVVVGHSSHYSAM